MAGGCDRSAAFIDEVDKTATQIGSLLRGPVQCPATSGRSEKLARELLLQGDYYLKNQIDSCTSSLRPRYWPQ